MKILGIDTTTKFLTVATLNGKKGIAEFRVNFGRHLSCYLLPSIERISRAIEVGLGEFDYFALGTGPGSFTGLRIGMSAIKGLAFALNKPILGISSLDILAYNAVSFSQSKGYKVCPIIDAKRGLVYAGLYVIRLGRLKRIMPYKLISAQELLKGLSSQVIFLGDGLRIYQSAIKKKVKGALFLDEDYWYPQPRNIISLALERIKKGMLDDANSVKPIYLYPKECQIRKSGLRIKK